MVGYNRRVFSLSGGNNHMQNNIEVSIETKDSRPIRVHHHDGRSYIQSNDNAVYQIRVKNKIDRRVKAVIVVDSLNIVNGKPATNEPNETGYILGPQEEQVFRGFRVDENTVAEFTFTKKEGSYATEVGAGAGNGVIAVRGYEEKETAAEKSLREMKKRIKELEDRPREKEYVPYWRYPSRPWYWEDHWYKPYRYDGVWAYGTSETVRGGSTTAGTLGGSGGSTGTTLRAMGMGYNAGDNTMFCNTSNANLQGSVSASNNMVKCALSAVTEDVQPFDMGTKWGSAVKDSVREVEFEVGKLIAEIVIYHCSVAGLKALGVNIDRVKSVVFPEPFKKTWCAKPSGWNG